MERTFNFGVSYRSVFSAAGFLALAAFTYWQFANYVIPSLAEIFEALDAEETITHAETAGFMWTPIIGYLLVSGNILLFVQIFKPLKAWPGDGLTKTLFYGLAGGLILGLILGLSAGDLAGGLILGLAGGLISGFGMGLAHELK